MIWVDGKILPNDGLSISVLDRTFEHGLGLFETLRTWGGRPTLLDRHKARMLRSASELGLPIDPASLPDDKAVRQLLEAEELESERMLRITASGGMVAGPSVVWMRSSPLPPPNREGGAIVCVNAWSFGAGLASCKIESAKSQTYGPMPDELPPPQGGREPEARSARGSIEAAMHQDHDPTTGELPPPQGGREPEARSARREWNPPYDPLAPRDFTTRHKTLNYWFKRAAYEQARARGYDETLISIEPWGFLEASRSSLFLVANQTLITCSTNAPIVPGIMRQLVLDVARDLPVECREVQRLEPEWLNDAEEVFLTNAVRGIIPVARIDTSGETIVRQAPGPWTLRLQELIARRLWPD